MKLRRVLRNIHPPGNMRLNTSRDCVRQTETVRLTQREAETGRICHRQREADRHTYSSVSPEDCRHRTGVGTRLAANRSGMPDAGVRILMFNHFFERFGSNFRVPVSEKWARPRDSYPSPKSDQKPTPQGPPGDPNSGTSGHTPTQAKS